MSAKQVTVKAELLFIGSSSGRQSTIAIYKDPETGLLSGMWGSALAPGGEKVRLKAGHPVKTALQFDEKLDGFESIQNVQSGKHESLGHHDLDLETMILRPAGMPKGDYDKAEASAPLPKVMSHPELKGSKDSRGVSWFF